MVGQAFMCTREKEFTIKGTADCLARGFDRTGFFEVDTGEQPSWTVQLTEPAELAPKTPLQSRNPPVQMPPAPAGPRPPRRRPPDPPEKQELMRRLRRTKIVATLGPSSSERDVIASLFRAGADVFRINMSHTSHERMRELVAAIRAVETECRTTDRHPGRSAGSEASGRQIQIRPVDARERRHLHARSDPTRVIRRVPSCHIRKSSPPPCRAMRSCSTTARCA